MTTFLEAIGFGLGSGVVHGLLLMSVLFLIRVKRRGIEESTIGLMRERNNLDEKKVILLKAIVEKMGEQR